MSRHLDSAVLRRYVDEPDVLLSYEKEHLLACAPCRATLEELRENAGVAEAALEQEDIEPDLDAARAAIAHRAATAAAPPVLVPARTLNWRWFASAAAAAVVMLLFSYAPFRVYAQSLLTIFEPHQITPISVTVADMKRMHAVPQLADVGTVRVVGASKEKQFASLASARRYAGIAVLHPDYLPDGLPHSGTYEVVAPSTVHFTFDARKAKASAARKHMTIPVPPPGVDGSTLSATTGPMVVGFYGMTPKDTDVGGMFPKNGVVVMQAPVPAVHSTSADARTIESYLISLPNIPESFKAQIRAIQDPAATVPIPVVIDRNSAREVQVHGARGLLIGDNTGVGSALTWVSQGRFYWVAGGFSSDDITKVADSMTQ